MGKKQVPAKGECVLFHVKNIGNAMYLSCIIVSLQVVLFPLVVSRKDSASCHLKTFPFKR